MRTTPYTHHRTESRSVGLCWAEGAACLGPSPPVAGVNPQLAPASPSAELVPQKGGRALIVVGQRETGNGSQFFPFTRAGAADLGAEVKLCLSRCPQRPVLLGTQRGQGPQPGADVSQTLRARRTCRLPPPHLTPPSFSWGLSTRPTLRARVPAKARPHLCTSCVFSCFSLLFRSPLLRLSFSSSVTFFSRKLTYRRGAGVGWRKPLSPQD